jgi:hypothetical protein
MPEQRSEKDITDINTEIAQLEIKKSNLKRELRRKEIDGHISNVLNASDIMI